MVAAIPRENKKFEQILETAKSLFFRFGFKRVTVEEICRTAHVSKMTFYKYFANKNDLLKFLINRIFSEGIAKYDSIMNQPIRYPEKVKQIIQLKLQQSEGMSFDFVREYFQGADPDIKQLIEQKTSEVMGIVIADFKKAQQQGFVRADLKPEFILYFINKMSEWSSDEKLFALYGSATELTAELINFFFYGVLARNQLQED